jgi:hypothetical protein
MSHPPGHSHTAPAPTAEPEADQAEKLRVLLAHWMTHNEAHAQTYRAWARRAETLGLGEVGARLVETVELTGSIRRALEAALKAMASPEGKTLETQAQAQAGAGSGSSEPK